MTLSPQLRVLEPAGKQVWAGLVQVSIKNISSEPVSGVSINIPECEYAMDVLDDNGTPAPLTEAGKRIPKTDREWTQCEFISARTFKLAPGQGFTVTLNLGEFFVIDPLRRYTVTIRRSRGLPNLDHQGQPIRELSVSTKLGLLGSNP
jgi:hypothetical protein